MITHEQIPQFYDWLSRYVQLSNWIAYRDRFAAFTMHKSLAVPGAANGGRNGLRAGLEYANQRMLAVAGEIGLPSAPRVLDAGCGFGGTIFHWQQVVGGRYDGLTLSKVQVEVAERHARERGIADACNFHLRSYDEPLQREYDAVVAIESLIHAADLKQTVGNLASALRPGGLLLVLDDMATGDLDVVRPADADLVRSHWGCPDSFPTDDDFRTAIELSGLTAIQEEDFSPLMRIRPEAFLGRQERVYSFVHRVVPLTPARTVVSAFLGGVALERLHGSGDVDYRLIVARNDEPEQA
ncbi:MAG: tocopherol O-methyltransferase [Solirubrobacteraceae bacterium]|nr:tocopherol O-methyltransferase [Solirubrobacteraceae bacterium]